MIKNRDKCLRYVISDRAQMSSATYTWCGGTCRSGTNAGDAPVTSAFSINSSCTSTSCGTSSGRTTFFLQWLKKNNHGSQQQQLKLESGFSLFVSSSITENTNCCQYYISSTTNNGSTTITTSINITRDTSQSAFSSTATGNSASVYRTSYIKNIIGNAIDFGKAFGSIQHTLCRRTLCRFDRYKKSLEGMIHLISGFNTTDRKRCR